jgi:hypothetical protein
MKTIKFKFSILKISRLFKINSFFLKLLINYSKIINKIHNFKLASSSKIKLSKKIKFFIQQELIFIVLLIII